MIEYEKNNLSRAKNLRKNMTPWERKLWFLFLSQYPIRFRRQQPIGRYIVDFYCPSARLIVELDGSEHYTEESIRYDRIRTDELVKKGFRLFRISNRDIDANFRSVCDKIDLLVREKTSDPL